MNKEFFYGLLALVFIILACRPVIAISWNELLIIGVLFTVLLGPPLYKFIQRVEEFFRHKTKNK